ncbi:GntR family transcriptional regulator [Brevibacterium sp. 'Marine']|uniref:GntR family transcriptional regulator n=1 Tax=Brevibacterium sp. 'Marine' TaxID=2725563 RepID=UPI00145D70B6|nr:GntR family transcriptional regulator [Brevibacterium sp. 'Marine']
MHTNPGPSPLTLLERVRSKITSGELEPGNPLSEVSLAQEFDVSRTPIREVLKQLQLEGLIEIRPKVGTFIREPSRREIVELFQLKEVLEGLAAALMARRGPCPELDQLEDIVAASEVSSNAGDTDTYAAQVQDFHQTMVAGADNTKLVEQYERLMNQLAYFRLVRRTLQHPGRAVNSSREHRQILTMIQDKDPFGAETTMRSHVFASTQELLIPQTRTTLSLEREE